MAAIFGAPAAGVKPRPQIIAIPQRNALPPSGGPGTPARPGGRGTASTESADGPEIDDLQGGIADRRHGPAALCRPRADAGAAPFRDRGTPAGAAAGVCAERAARRPPRHAAVRARPVRHRRARTVAARPERATAALDRARPARRAAPGQGLRARRTRHAVCLRQRRARVVGGHPPQAGAAREPHGVADPAAAGAGAGGAGGALDAVAADGAGRPGLAEQRRRAARTGAAAVDGAPAP